MRDSLLRRLGGWLALTLVVGSIATRRDVAGQAPADKARIPVITGTVRDEQGRPVPDVWVTAARVTDAARVASERYGAGGHQAGTDGAGEFRFSQLAPGEYVVMVVARHRTSPIDPDGEPCLHGVLIPSGIPEDFQFAPVTLVEPVRGVFDTTGSAFWSIEPGLTPPVTRGGAAVSYVTTYAPGATAVNSARRYVVAANGSDLRADVTLRLQPSVRVVGRIAEGFPPLKGWRLRLELAGPFGLVHASTNTKGEFVLMDVPVGSYELTAEYEPWCGGILNPIRWRTQTSWTVGPRDLNGVLVTLEPPVGRLGSASLLVASEPAPDASRRRVGSAVITGRVTSADGLPLDRVLLDLWNRDDMPSRTAVTDDDGRFTFEELPAGRFTLTASRHGFVPARYGQKHRTRPGTQIHLAEGERFDGAMTLAAHGSISGTVRDEYGEPVAGAEVWGADLARTDRAGQYRMLAVPPGEYKIFARTFRPAYSRTYFPGVREAGQAVDVSVSAGLATTGIDIQMLPGESIALPPDAALQTSTETSLQTIPARVVFDGSPGASLPTHATVHLISVADEPPWRAIGPGDTTSVMVSSAWRGRLQATPGAQLATVEVAGWHARSAMVGARDALDVPFVPAEGQEVVVTLTDRFTTLRGTVRDGLGRPTADATVVVFSVNPQFWTAHSRRIRIVHPWSSGAFELSGLPAGDYAVAALSDLPSSRRLDADLLERLSVTPARVRLAEGTTVDRDVPMIDVP